MELEILAVVGKPNALLSIPKRRISAFQDRNFRPSLQMVLTEFRYPYACPIAWMHNWLIFLESSYILFTLNLFLGKLTHMFTVVKYCASLFSSFR